jgi:hypothetical protein
VCGVEESDDIGVDELPFKRREVERRVEISMRLTALRVPRFDALKTCGLVRPGASSVVRVPIQSGPSAIHAAFSGAAER